MSVLIQQFLGNGNPKEIGQYDGSCRARITPYTFHSFPGTKFALILCGNVRKIKSFHHLFQANFTSAEHFVTLVVLLPMKAGDDCILRPKLIKPRLEQVELNGFNQHILPDFSSDC